MINTAYRHIWTTELGNEETREFEEYHLDVRYNLDTDEITDVKAKLAEQIDSNLSVMEQAEQLTNQLEAEKRSREYEWNASLLHGIMKKIHIPI